MGDGVAAGVGDEAGLVVGVAGVAGVVGVTEGLGVAPCRADGDAGLRGLRVGVGASVGDPGCAGAGLDVFWLAGSARRWTGGVAGPGRTST